MAARSIRHRIDDMLGEIDLVAMLVREGDAEAIARDPIRRRALERCLEIISEASRHLPDDMKARHPLIRWKRMADFGNWTRHAYPSVDFQILWGIAHDELAPLATALLVERAAAPTDNQEGFG